MNKRNPTFLRKHELGIPLLGRRFPFSLTPPFQKTPSTSSASFTRHNPLPSSPQLHPNPQKNAILKKKKSQDKGKAPLLPEHRRPKLTQSSKARQDASRHMPRKTKESRDKKKKGREREIKKSAAATDCQGLKYVQNLEV